MLIGMFIILSLLPLVAVAVLIVKINSNKLHLILLGFIIGMVALIQPLLVLFAESKEVHDVFHGGGPIFALEILFVCFNIFILVLSGILTFHVHTNSKSISKPLRIICRLPFIIGMGIFFLFFTGFPFY